MTYGAETFKKLSILSLKPVILSLFSQLFKKYKTNILKTAVLACCYDHNPENTSCSENIVASLIYYGEGFYMHACISSTFV